MSRSTVAKSRQEKTNKTTSAPTPAVTHEIVPGKFNDQDWNVMLDHDDGEEFVYNMVDDMCNSALDQIFQNYIQRQLVPYTVLQAKDAILQIIEWQFLANDEGEGNIGDDLGWTQDIEPEPAVTDCWAQGSVPKTMLPLPTPEPIPEEDENEVTVQEEEETQIGTAEPIELPTPLDTEPTVIVEEKSSMAIEETIIENQDDTESIPPQIGKRRKRHYKSHKGPLRSAGLGRMTESLEQTELRLLKEMHAVQIASSSPDPMQMQMPTSCQSILKLQAGRPPGNRDVIYDDHGNVVSVTKLDPERLPTHSVKLKFKVVDPSVEAAQSRLEAMRTGKYIKNKRLPRPPESPRSSTVTRPSLHRLNGLPLSQLQEGVTPLPPPLLECMEVSAGVVVREGDRVKKGPRQRAKQSELIAAATQRGLRAIRINPASPTVTVSQIIQQQQPVVRQLASDVAPIPPIAGQHQSPVC